MTKQKGIALISLIFGLLLIAAIPLTINQVQKNQNPQNRAATLNCLQEYQKDCFIIPCCPDLVCDRGICIKQNSYQFSPTPVQTTEVNCQEIKNLYQKYCQVQLSNPPQVPCSTIQNLINQYCQN